MVDINEIIQFASLPFQQLGSAIFQAKYFKNAGQLECLLRGQRNCPHPFIAWIGCVPQIERVPPKDLTFEGLDWMIGDERLGENRPTVTVDFNIKKGIPLPLRN